MVINPIKCQQYFWVIFNQQVAYTDTLTEQYGIQKQKIWESQISAKGPHFNSIIHKSMKRIINTAMKMLIFSLEV